MTFNEFDNFQAQLLAEVVKMKDTKGKEYANGVDRFANFNEDAKDNGIDRLAAASIFLNKHMRALKSFIRTKKVYSEPVRGRIVDAIVYLTLIAGMIEEQQLLNKDDLKVMGINERNSGKHQPFEYDSTRPDIIEAGI